MITVREAIDKFGSVTSINAELKRIAPIKANHRVWAQWGNVERRESYNMILDYERVLKKAKEQLKKEYPISGKIAVTEQAVALCTLMKSRYDCTSCTTVTAQRYINQLVEGETPNIDGLFSFWFNNK